MVARQIFTKFSSFRFLSKAFFLVGVLLFVVAVIQSGVSFMPQKTDAAGGGGTHHIDYCPPDYEDWSPQSVTNYAAAINSSSWPDCKYLAVMWCESHYKWNAFNGNHRGIYQFNYSTWTETINQYLGSRYATADICPPPVPTDYTVVSSDADYNPDRYIWSPFRQAGAFNYWVTHDYTSKWTCWPSTYCPSP